MNTKTKGKYSEKGKYKNYKREDGKLMMLESKKILTTNKGISLISLIIIIIVIIILAAIVIFMGLGTPDQANFARFAQEFSDFNLAVDNAYMKEFQDNALANKTRSKEQIYYKIASGVDVGLDGEPVVAGNVSDLGDMAPEGLKGTEYYLVTSDKNIDGWKQEKKYFEEQEKHYITNAGEAFMLPGYFVEGANGEEKWYVNERKYYEGTKKTPEGGNAVVISPEEQGRLDSNSVKVLTSAEIATLPNAEAMTSNSIKMVLQGEVGVVPVPQGFEYVLGTEQGGLVIKDTSENANEFVWIPVTAEEFSKMYAKNATEVSVNHANATFSVTTDTYGQSVLGSSYSMGLPNSTSGYREPAVVVGDGTQYDAGTYEDENGNDKFHYQLAGFNSLVDFAQDMVNEFNAMLDSVEKYGGFYGGRYELGWDDGVVCKAGVTELSAAATSGTGYYGSATTQKWYGLYNACKSFSSGSVKSGMIWGSQWDMMCDFLSDASNYSNTAEVLIGRKATGGYNDDIKHVNDTRGGLYEWAATAGSTLSRALRGGYYVYAASASHRSGYSPDVADLYSGTRPQLYLK